MAKSQKRSRSDLLLEMVEAYMNRRSASQAEDRLSAKLDRLAREVSKTSNECVVISHSLYRFIRHQLIYAAALPDARRGCKNAGREAVSGVSRFRRTDAGQERRQRQRASRRKQGQTKHDPSARRPSAALDFLWCLPASLPGRVGLSRLALRATAHGRGCGLDSPPQPARQKLAKHQRTIRAWEAPATAVPVNTRAGGDNPHPGKRFLPWRSARRQRPTFRT